MNSGRARCSISAFAASTFPLLFGIERNCGLIGEMIAFGPPGSSEDAEPLYSSGSWLRAAIPTEPVLAMNAACPERYALLSPAPSQVVTPGGNSFLSQALFSQRRYVRVSSDLMATFLPASSAMRPPIACSTSTCVLPSPTFESASPSPYTPLPFTASACLTSSSQVFGASLNPAASNRSLRRSSRLPLTPNGIPVRPPPPNGRVSVPRSTPSNQPPYRLPIAS